MRPDTYALPTNPVTHADRRREAEPEQFLEYYSVEQVEALARALTTGLHRAASRKVVDECEIAARAAEDAQDGELARVATYVGLRLGELLALRWRDVDFTGRKLILRRRVSDGVELPSTKSRHAREVPLPDQAAAALDRLSRRADFTGPDEYVFCNRLGGRLDPSAVRRRYKKARDAVGLPELRFHDLRHTYGSLLVADGVDPKSVKDAMGHARLTTTDRYLHSRPATERAERFTRAFRGLGTTTASDGEPSGTERSRQDAA